MSQYLTLAERNAVSGAYRKMVCEAHEETNAFGYATDEELRADQRPRNEFQREVLQLLTSPEYEDYIRDFHFNDDEVCINIERSLDGSEEITDKLGTEIERLTWKTRELPYPQRWEWARTDRWGGVLEYICKGGSRYIGAAPGDADVDYLLSDKLVGELDANESACVSESEFTDAEQYIQDVNFDGDQTPRDEFQKEVLAIASDDDFADYIVELKFCDDKAYVKLNTELQGYETAFEDFTYALFRMNTAMKNANRKFGDAAVYEDWQDDETGEVMYYKTSIRRNAKQSYLKRANSEIGISKNESADDTVFVDTDGREYSEDESDDAKAWLRKNFPYLVDEAIKNVGMCADEDEEDDFAYCYMAHAVDKNTVDIYDFDAAEPDKLMEEIEKSVWDYYNEEYQKYKAEHEDDINDERADGWDGEDGPEYEPQYA